MPVPSGESSALLPKSGSDEDSKSERRKSGKSGRSDKSIKSQSEKSETSKKSQLESSGGGASGKKKGSGETDATQATSRKDGRSARVSSTETSAVSTKKPNQMSHEKEFEKGPLGWALTVVFLVSLWIAGGVFTLAFLKLLSLRVDDTPVYFGTGSFIGGNPRVVFEPNPSRFDVSTRSVIKFNRKKFESYQNLLIRYNKIIDKEYSSTPPKCNEKNVMENGKKTDKTCAMEVEEEHKEWEEGEKTNLGYGPCELTVDNLERSGMGFADGKPCIMLRLTKILGWFPMFNDTGSKVEAALSGQVSSEEGRKCTQPCCSSKRISFKCEAQNKEANVTMVQYPSDGMDSCSFPFWNQKDYQSPYVMMRFDLTNTKPGNITEIRCTPLLNQIHLMDDKQENFVKIKFEMT